MYNANTMKYDQNWNRGWQHKERRYIYIYKLLSSRQSDLEIGKCHVDKT